MNFHINFRLNHKSPIRNIQSIVGSSVSLQISVYLSMGLIEDELQEVQKLCEHLIDGSRLVSCVPTMVRVEIKKASCKQLVVCIQFPDEYPEYPLLVELKSKTLSDKLLYKLTAVSEQETKKYLGKPQILKLLQFLRNFLDENPLSCCYDEISVIKESLLDSDDLKLKQKTSTICFKITKDNYYFKGKVFIPDDYPVVAIRLDEAAESNLPNLFHRFIIGQAKEIARQCVEPPLLKKRGNKGGTVVPFKASPSLLPVVRFIIKTVRMVPGENCQLCLKSCLPYHPKDVENNESASQHIERVYCGHLFHLSCLITYMKTPPFQGGKKCPSCNQRIYHDKWKLSEKLAEDRWAHEQARNRELKEVEEFFK